jgi:hypothetical protein
MPWRIGPNQLELTESPGGLVRIFDLPALGMLFKDLDGSSVLYKLLGLTRKPALKYRVARRPEEPVSVRLFRAKIVRCACQSSKLSSD